MPHITLEYSDNIADTPSFNDLFEDYHKTLVDMEVCPRGAIKSRALKHTDFYIADGSANNAFVHVTVALMPGRSIELKDQIGEAFHALLKQYYPTTLSSVPCSLTVEIRELDGDTYKKESTLKN